MRLKETGFDKPTPIQAVAIPEILKGENCALQSYTGSGKVRKAFCSRKDLDLDLGLYATVINIGHRKSA